MSVPDPLSVADVHPDLSPSLQRRTPAALRRKEANQ